MAPVQSGSGLECEFPAELDEFLQLCLEEHGEDWQAIAVDFLDIAAGLDETLQERANDFFSPTVLQKRWLELRQSEAAQGADVCTAPNVAMPTAMESPGSTAVHYENVPSLASQPKASPPHIEPVPQSWPHRSHALAPVQNLPSTMDLGDEVDALLAELSEESGDDDDFAQMRRAVKTSSSNLISTKNASGAAIGQKPACRAACPPQHCKRIDETKGAATSGQACPGSDCEMMLEDLSTDAEEADDEYGEYDVATLPIRVLKELLHKAPDGICSSYTWFNATRQWPQLPVHLGGSPEFSHRDGDLKVLLDIARLRSVLSEQQQTYAELCQAREKKAEGFANGTVDFIRETEKRRLMVGRSMGGSVLCSRN